MEDTSSGETPHFGESANMQGSCSREGLGVHFAAAKAKGVRFPNLQPYKLKEQMLFPYD